MTMASWTTKTTTSTLVVLVSTLVAVSAVGYDICYEPMCDCDSFSRVICRCRGEYEELVVRPDGPYKVKSTATQLEIHNCHRVYVKPNTIFSLRELKSVRFTNISNLVLEENSLNWYPDPKYTLELPYGVRIAIHNTTMAELPSYSIKGRIESVVLSSVDINIVKPYAFSSLIETNSIEIKDCTLGSVETQVFKKFNVDNFVFKNNTVGELPSRMLSDVNVSNSFVLENNRVQKIRSYFAIVRETRRVEIAGNFFRLIEGIPFQMTIRGDVHVKNNVMLELKSKIFSNIVVYKQVSDRGLMNFYLINNTISAFEYDSLAIDLDSFNLRPKQLYVDTKCSCEEINLFRTSILNEEMYCKYANGQFRHLTTYKKDVCYTKSLSISVIVVIVVFSILIIVALVVAVVYFLRKYCTNQESIFRVNQKPEIIKPDGKTYKETELYVIVEKAELLTTDL